MNENPILFCEWIEEGGERAVICPFLIKGLGELDYCGYYGKDIGEARKRLEFCDIEAVVKATEEKRSRRVEKEPFPGEG